MILYMIIVIIIIIIIIHVTIRGDIGKEAIILFTVAPVLSHTQ